MNPAVLTPTLNILISLETIHDNRTALDRLAELAALLKAGLHGLYVEDEELLAIAELPFTQEVCLHTRRENALEPHRLEQQMRTVARQAETLLAQTAKQWNVEWRFQRVRGKVIAELSKAAQQTHMVSILAGNRSSYWGRDLPSEKADFNEFMGKPCVIFPPQIAAGDEIITVIDDQHALAGLLEPAYLISGQGKRPVIILLQNDHQENLRHQIVRFFRPHQLLPEIISLPLSNRQQLIDFLNRRAARMVIIHAENSLLENCPPETWVRQLNTPVMLIK